MKSAVAFILVATLSHGADIPVTLMSEDEAEPIHSAIVRKEAWTLDDARRLRADAERHLKEGPWTVTAERPRDTDLDIHEYYSEAPYWWPNLDNPGGPYIRKEGQANPDRFLAGRTALNAMCDAVFSLSAAAFFLDDTRYAHRAARVIQTWFLNPKTHMSPNLEHAQTIPGNSTGQPAGIMDGRPLIRAIQGMEFLQQTGVWDAKEQAGVRRWFEEYLHWLTRSRDGEEVKRSGNYNASWWTAQVAAVATFVEDKPVQQMAFNYYRDHIFHRQIRGNGSAPREESRPRPLWSSVTNLEAYTVICRIAQVQGVDLWSVRTRNGATIATVINYLEPYLAERRKWNKEQVPEIPADALYSLAYAGMGLKKPEYVALFRKLERPDGAWQTFVDLMVSRWEAAAHQTRH